MKSLRDILKVEELSEEQIARIEAQAREDLLHIAAADKLPSGQAESIVDGIRWPQTDGGSVIVAEEPFEGDSSERLAVLAEVEQTDREAELRISEAYRKFYDSDGELDEPEERGEENNDGLDPVARARAKLHRPWQIRFVDKLYESADLSAAYHAANLSMKQCKRWKKADPVFSEAWDAAWGSHIDRVESTVFEAAKSGDARLCEFVMRTWKPEIYREKLDVSVTGQVLHAHLSQLDVESVVARLSPLMSALQPAKVIENGGGK